MKILVTGGLGFIGHHVVRLLENHNHQCFIVDNTTDYGFIPADELSYLIAERKSRIKSEVYLADIVDSHRVNEIFEQIGNIDIIIHLASFPRQKVVAANPKLAADVMCSGLINLLEAARNFKVSKFVYISSSMVYGDFDCGVTETAVCKPQGQYGIMKLMGEHLVQDYARQGHFEHVIIRPSAVYGEYDVEDRVVSKFMLSAIRNQTIQVRGAEEILDFTHVSDTANGIFLSTVSTCATGIFNITHSDIYPWTLMAAAQKCCSIASGGKIVVADRDLNFPRRGRLNIDRARQLLAYNPVVPVNKGFRQYYDWFISSSFWKDRV
jgi:nucleoside-diphosphate-sugar epimerase